MRALILYQNGNGRLSTSHSPPLPAVSACAERCQRKDGVVAVGNGLKVEKRLKATGFDEQ